MTDWLHPDTIQLAKDNEWWEIEEHEEHDEHDDIPVPQSAKEFYALWERLSREWNGIGNVVVAVPLVGHFDVRHGADDRVVAIHKIEPVQRHPANDGWQSGGTHRPATGAELSDLDWSIRHGCVNLILQPISNFDNAQNATILYGTGKPFEGEQE